MLNLHDFLNASMLLDMFAYLCINAWAQDVHADGVCIVWSGFIVYFVLMHDNSREIIVIITAAPSKPFPAPKKKKVCVVKLQN